MTNYTEKIENLRIEKTNLTNQLRGNMQERKESGIFERIKEIQKEIKELEFLRLIQEKNAKYSRLRQTARQVFESERPDINIFTNEGYIHKTKGKKYPKLNALQYASFQFKNGFLVSARVNGEKFNLCKTIYKSGEPDKFEYYQTFEEFLKENSIPVNDFTSEDLKQVGEKLNQLNSALQSEIEKYKQGLKSVDSYNLEFWGLLNRRQEYLYLSEPNF